MKKHVFAVLLFMTGAVLPAKVSNVLPSQTELSHTSVTCMTEDRDGLIWIGTVRGLNRFNGSTYKVFEHGDGGSLMDDQIVSLCSDEENRIWVGTFSGLNLIRGGAVDTCINIAVGPVYSVDNFGKGHLLFSGRNKLYLLNKNTGSWSPVYFDRRITYNSLMVTSSRKVWINHVNRPILTVLDNSFRQLRDIELENMSIQSFREAPDGSVYVATDRGLLRYSDEGESLPLPPAVEKIAGPGKAVLFCVREKGGDEMLLGIRDEGLFSFSDESSPERVWRQESLSGIQSCRALFTANNIWLSKQQRGLVYVSRNRRNTLYQVQQGDRSESLDMFYQWTDGKLLVLSTRNIYEYDIETTERRIIPADGVGGGDLLGNSVIDGQGHLWVVVNNNRLHEYVMDGNRFRLVGTRQVQSATGMWLNEHGRVELLQGDHILTLGDGTVSSRPVSSVPDFWFCSMTGSGKVYFLSPDGIWFLEGGSVFRRLDFNGIAPSSFYEDEKGIYWIGTAGDGLFRYDPADGSSLRIGHEQGLHDLSIRSVQGDSDGNIWVCSRYDVARISVADMQVAGFGEEEELSLTFATNSSLSIPGGKVFFGGINVIIAYDTAVQDDDAVVPVTMDGILVNGMDILDSCPEEIVLGHRTRQISFFFSGMCFDPDIRLQYQYMLDGYDEDWIYGGQSIRAGYSGLESGHYDFRVRVLGPSGIWSDVMLDQKIYIKAAPWLSWPALLCYWIFGISAVLAGLWHLYRIRRDRERLKWAEQERILSEQLSEERTTFFANVSHEFRTPLALIHGPVRELSRSEKLDSHEKNLVSVIEKNSDRMIRLTDQLLHFNRSVSMMDKLSVMQTDLTLLLRRMLENFEYMFREKNLRVSLEPLNGINVYCDREKVEKIFFNLISNAVKYTPEYGEISVKTVLDGGVASVSVADTGIGISPDKMEKVFDRFERLGETVGGEIPSGFGVGLNYARELARIHRGDLTVRANEPLGTVFTLSFPATQESYSAEEIWREDEPEAEPAVVETGDTAGEDVNILVVEDNPDMREYIRGFLKRQYNYVSVAGDGEEAWKCIRISAPDMIISDVMMPYKDGYTLCREIKNDAEYCHIPVVLLTAKADMENRITGIRFGADAYIGKPFDPAYMTAVVQNLLENRKRIQNMLRERTSMEEAPAEDVQLNARDRAFLDRLYKLMEEHLSEEDFNVTTLSLEMGLSRTSLFSKLKALVGESPQSFLTSYRLNRAMELLKSREYNVSEVSYKVGFGTLTGFSRSFKNKFGISPSSV